MIAYRWLFAFLLLASGAAVAQTTPGAHVPLEHLLGNEYGAASKMSGATTTGGSTGAAVERAYDKIMRDTRDRARKVPLKAKAILPKARITAGAAAQCIAFPLKCVGTLAFGLAAQGITSEGGDLIRRFTANGRCLGSSASPGMGIPADLVIYGINGDCHSNFKELHDSVVSHAAWSSQTLGSHKTSDGWIVCNLQSGTPLHYLGHWATNASTAAVNPASDAQVKAAYDVADNTWQDTSFAAVFAAAVEAGAKYPITVTDFAEVKAGATAPEKVVTSTSTTTETGAVETQTQTSDMTVTSVGTTAATAEAVVKDVVTTTTTTAAGTKTVVETGTPTTDPQDQPTTGTGTDSDTPVEVTVDFPCGGPGLPACTVEVQGTFSTPTATTPTIPGALTFQQSTQHFLDVVAASPWFGLIGQLELSSGGDCPEVPLSIPYIGYSGAFTFHCDVVSQIGPILSGVMLAFWLLIAVRRVLSA